MGIMLQNLEHTNNEKKLDQFYLLARIMQGFYI